MSSFLSSVNFLDLSIVFSMDTSCGSGYCIAKFESLVNLVKFLRNFSRQRSGSKHSLFSVILAGIILLSCVSMLVAVWLRYLHYSLCVSILVAIYLCYLHYSACVSLFMAVYLCYLHYNMCVSILMAVYLCYLHSAYVFQFLWLYICIICTTAYVF